MRIASNCFIKNKEDKFLLLYHIKQDHWTPPGGKREDYESESSRECIIRELNEEVNLNLYTEELNPYLKNLMKVSDVITHVCGEYNWILHLYYIDNLPESWNPTNNEPTKHSDMQWFSIDELEKLDKISHSVDLLLTMHKAFDEYKQYVNDR